MNVQKVGVASLEELPDRLAVLNAFNKSAIESRESGRILGRINELREAHRVLEAEKKEIAGDLVDMLSNKVSDTIASLAQSQPKELVDRLLQILNPRLMQIPGVVVSIQARVVAMLLSQ